MKRQGATHANLIVQPKPPTIAEIEAWKAENGAGEYSAMTGKDKRIEQITWQNPADHMLFMKWVMQRAS
ncbi:hypothetical protein MOP88_14405 [Sphingomonas sp. WKB10]|nr:hypothetical protein [Sphingomonas sp. WKB10]